MTQRSKWMVKPGRITLTFDGRTYKTPKLAESHETKILSRLSDYLKHMPHARCYAIEGDVCDAFYVSDDLDWTYLKLEVERIEDQFGYHSTVVNKGIGRLYRMKVSQKERELLLAPFDEHYIATGKIDSQICQINKMREKYKNERYFINEEKRPCYDL